MTHILLSNQYRDTSANDNFLRVFSYNYSAAKESSIVVWSLYKVTFSIKNTGTTVAAIRPHCSIGWTY